MKHCASIALNPSWQLSDQGDNERGAIKEGCLKTEFDVRAIFSSKNAFLCAFVQTLSSLTQWKAEQ
jgi:hypothetical protein